MPRRRISKAQAVLAVFIVAAMLSSVYVLTLGPHTAASTNEVTGADETIGTIGIEIVARVVAVQGSVTVVRPPQGSERYTRYLRPVKEGLALFAGDQIWTGSDSWVEIDFGDEVRVRIDPRSRAEIASGLRPLSAGGSGEEKPTLRLYLGEVWASVVSLVSRFTNFSIETPTAIAGVRGTLFQVSVDVLGKTSVSVNEGIVAVAKFDERTAEVLVASGELTNVIAGQRPDPPTLLTPDVKQEWDTRSEWVMAHFERKEAYEQRWALAQGESAAPPETLSDAKEETGERFTRDVAQVASEPKPASQPAYDGPKVSDVQNAQQARPSGTVGIASVETAREVPPSAATVEQAIDDDSPIGDEKKDEEKTDDEKNDDEEDVETPEDGAQAGDAQGGANSDDPKDDDEQEDRTVEDEPAESDPPPDQAAGPPRNRPQGGPARGVDRADRLAEELTNVREKIAERLEVAGVELDRLWADLESALNRELSEFDVRLRDRGEDGRALRPFQVFMGSQSRGSSDTGDPGEDSASDGGDDGE